MASGHVFHEESLDDFVQLGVLGEGTFGRVLHVRRRRPPAAPGKSTSADASRDDETFAIKVMKCGTGDADALDEAERVATNEIGVLTAIESHPFVVRLYHSFVSAAAGVCSHCLVLEYLPGGDFRAFLNSMRGGRLTQSAATFYFAEIVLAIQYLHECSIVYRDLKPENMLLGGDGHLRLVDFGLARTGVTEVGGSTCAPGGGASSFCGTPQYLPPEMLKGAEHGTAVDWWTAGVVFYEMLVGAVPFELGPEQAEASSGTADGVALALFHLVCSAPVQCPRHVSREARTLVGALLVRAPEDRLGSGPLGTMELRSHALFEVEGIDWALMQERKVPPPLRRGNTSPHQPLPAQAAARTVVHAAGQPSPRASEAVEQEVIQRADNQCIYPSAVAEFRVSNASLAHNYSDTESDDDAIEATVPSIERPCSELHSAVSELLHSDGVKDCGGDGDDIADCYGYYNGGSGGERDSIGDTSVLERHRSEVCEAGFGVAAVEMDCDRQGTQQRQQEAETVQWTICAAVVRLQTWVRARQARLRLATMRQERLNMTQRVDAATLLQTAQRMRIARRIAKLERHKRAAQKQLDHEMKERVTAENKDLLNELAVLEHAIFLGINPDREAYLLGLAEEALLAPLPAPWAAVTDGKRDCTFFHNAVTGESVWTHPMDAHYRELVEKQRAQHAGENECGQDRAANVDKRREDVAPSCVAEDSVESERTDVCDRALRTAGAEPGVSTSVNTTDEGEAQSKADASNSTRRGSFARLQSWLAGIDISLGLDAGAELDVDWEGAFEGRSRPAAKIPALAPVPPPPTVDQPCSSRTGLLPDANDFNVDWGTTFGGKPLKNDMQPVPLPPPPTLVSTATQEAMRWLNSWRLSFTPAVVASADTGPHSATTGPEAAAAEGKASNSSHVVNAKLNNEKVPEQDTQQQHSSIMHQHVRLGPAALERLAKIQRQRRGVAQVPKEVGTSASPDPMWVRAFDEARGIPYYYHRETYESRWLAPAAAKCAKGVTVVKDQSKSMRLTATRGSTAAVLTPVANGTNANPLIVTPISSEETVEV